ALVVLTAFITAAPACSRNPKQGAADGDATGAVPAAQAGDRTVIQNKGSDTLVNVAQAWAEAYKEVDPSTAIAVTGGGSGPGIPALINGTVDLANSSRKIEPKEVEAAAKNKVSPVQFIVGHDALAVFLHRDNP